MFVHSAGGGLAGSTKLSRSMLSAIRVAVSMKVSMKGWNWSFLVLATLRATILSSLTSLQWNRTKDRATSAPQRADDFFHSCTRPGISFRRVIRDSRSFWNSAWGQSFMSIYDTTTFRRDSNRSTFIATSSLTGEFMGSRSVSIRPVSASKS